MHSDMQCACCGIPIRWQPTIVNGNIYCCLGCAHGGPCECDYDQLLENIQIRPMVLRVPSAEDEAC